jgi:hypothetical protein
MDSFNLSTSMPIKKKTLRKILWPFWVTILITNWQGFKNLTGINDWYYMYSNKSGTLTNLEEPRWAYVFPKPKENQIYPYPLIAGPLDCREKGFIPKNDTIICRTFAINPLKFWRWGEYLFNWRYKLPYTNWDKVQQKRGFGILKVSKDCMQF